MLVVGPIQLRLLRLQGNALRAVIATYPMRSEQRDELVGAAGRVPDGVDGYLHALQPLWRGAGDHSVSGHALRAGGSGDGVAGVQCSDGDDRLTVLTLIRHGLLWELAYVR